MSSAQPIFERNQEATIYVGNLDPKVTDEILWELFTQCGPVVNVHLPRDKITGEHTGFGFVEFRSEEDADYAIKIMHMIKLYQKPIKVNKASQDKRTQEVGANLFIGNLDPEVDEKTLYEFFSQFGLILSTKIMREPDTGKSKGYGFVSYDNFDSSDTALNTMNGQYFYNKALHIAYSFKKEGKGDEHYGSAAERLLAANKPNAIPMLKPISYGLRNPYENAGSLQMPMALLTQPQYQQPQPPQFPPGYPSQGMPPQGIPQGMLSQGMPPMFAPNQPHMPPQQMNQMPFPKPPPPNMPPPNFMQQSF